VRLHYTGRTLLLKRSNLGLANTNGNPSQNDEIFQISRPAGRNSNSIEAGGGRKQKSEEQFMVKEEEMLHAACGMIRRDPALRKELSERVYRGIAEKGPGVLITNVCCVDSVRPKFVDNLQELLSPQQSVWMSNKELTKKYGRFWTHGRTNVFGPGLEWPEMCQTTALFTKQCPLLEWNDRMAPRGSTAEQIVGYRTYYENHNIIQGHAMEVMRNHFARRFMGEHPPMDYVSQEERHVMTMMKLKGIYDEMADMYMRWAREPTSLYLGILPPSMPRLGDGPLWKDHDAMDGYQHCGSFFLLSFHPIPAAIEKLQVIDGTFDGWRVLQFENVGFSSPRVETLLAKTTTNEEKLRLFARNKEDELAEAALTFQGGSFLTNLPSSTRVKNKYCANPDCNYIESRAKNIATGERLHLMDGKLSKCSQCESELYCSRECQKPDWKRHKKMCRKR
jgi:hypothetical protein